MLLVDDENGKCALNIKVVPRHHGKLKFKKYRNLKDDRTGKRCAERAQKGGMKGGRTGETKTVTERESERN